MHFCFHIFPGSPENNYRKERMRQEREKSKFRHKFTTEEVKILKQEFKNSPYPFFETKDELAQQFQCDVNVIDVSYISAVGWPFVKSFGKCKES